jgi:hypothetical protein
MTHNIYTREPAVVHVIVSGKSGRVVYHESIARKAYSSDSNFNRAIKTRFNNLQKEYPKDKYRIDLMLSHSQRPITLTSSSTASSDLME